MGTECVGAGVITVSGCRELRCVGRDRKKNSGGAWGGGWGGFPASDSVAFSPALQLQICYPIPAVRLQACCTGLLSALRKKNYKKRLEKIISPKQIACPVDVAFSGFCHQVLTFFGLFRPPLSAHAPRGEEGACSGFVLQPHTGAIIARIAPAPFPLPNHPSPLQPSRAVKPLILKKNLTIPSSPNSFRR